jgi:hypothetical protein
MNTQTAQLNGWKEIACYFSRSVRCVQRWDKSEGLPVYRHAHRRGASVYAITTDLDEWWAGNAEASKKSSFGKRYDEKLKSI